MRVLVTGSSGFLGWHLVTHLEHAGVEVHGTYVSNCPAFERAEVHRLDIRQLGECERLIARLSPSHLVHTAAMSQTGDCERNPTLAKAINVDGTGNLLRAANAMGEARPHFVHLSTDLVFDGTDAPYVESIAPAPIQAYGKTKLEAEHLVQQYSGVWTILRSALIYGAESTFHQSFLQWMLSLLRGECDGKLFADEVRSPVWVTDLCRAIESVCNAGTEGLFHCGGTERLSRWEFGKLVGQAYGLHLNTSLQGTRIESGLESTRPADVSLDSVKLQNRLNWTPRRCEEALQNIRVSAS